MTLVLRFLVALISNRLLVLCGVSKAISIFTRIVFSCQVSPGITVGKNLVLAYGGLGTVLNGKSVIGDNVVIGVNVLIGGNLSKKGAPKIGDNVFIGPGVKILGPVSIGNNSIIGANSVVLTDIPECSVFAGSPAVFKRHRDQISSMYK